jgi:hypothetical protein
MNMRHEVLQLLAEMKRACADQPQALRQTICLEALISQRAFPDDEQISPQLIPLRAQAILAQAFREIGTA